MVFHSRDNGLTKKRKTAGAVFLRRRGALLPGRSEIISLEVFGKLLDPRGLLGGFLRGQEYPGELEQLLLFHPAKRKPPVRYAAAV